NVEVGLHRLDSTVERSESTGVRFSVSFKDGGRIFQDYGELQRKADVVLKRPRLI
ncbi:UNVERIFIED_CONTAM: hypothetical protein K2H54_020312, partial [Gekko kuhli]